MSYRALITIQSVADGEVPNQCYATLALDEDFRNGEQVAELLLKQRNYPNAAEFAENSGYSFGMDYRGYHWEPTRYRADLADQEWVITFEVKGDYTRATITGKDAGGTMIFFRSVVYG